MSPPLHPKHNTLASRTTSSTACNNTRYVHVDPCMTSVRKSPKTPVRRVRESNGVHISYSFVDVRNDGIPRETQAKVDPASLQIVENCHGELQLAAELILSMNGMPRVMMTLDSRRPTVRNIDCPSLFFVKTGLKPLLHALCQGHDDIALRILSDFSHFRQ